MHDQTAGPRSSTPGCLGILAIVALPPAAALWLQGVVLGDRGHCFADPPVTITVISDLVQLVVFCYLATGVAVAVGRAPRVRRLRRLWRIACVAALAAAQIVVVGMVYAPMRTDSNALPCDTPQLEPGPDLPPSVAVGKPSGSLSRVEADASSGTETVEQRTY